MRIDNNFRQVSNLLIVRKIPKAFDLGGLKYPTAQPLQAQQVRVSTDPAVAAMLDEMDAYAAIGRRRK